MSQTSCATITPHTRYFLEEEVGVDPNTRKGTCRFQDGVTSRCDYPSIVVPQGFEPRFHGPKPRVLPLDEGTIMKPICQRTFSFEVSIGFEPMTPGYKAGILPNYTKKPI